jgi:hypothetical protein
MVRVLKAVGYDIGFCRGEEYLYDREGTRYLDLLSGFGVFAIGRNHPTFARGAKKRPRQRASQSRSDGCIDARRHSRRAAWRTCPISTKYFSQIRARKQWRRRLNLPAQLLAARDHLLRTRFPWSFLWSVVSQWRRPISQRLRAPTARLRSHSLQ